MVMPTLGRQVYVAVSLTLRIKMSVALRPPSPLPTSKNELSIATVHHPRNVYKIASRNPNNLGTVQAEQRAKRACLFAFVDVGKSTSSRLRFPECLSRLVRFNSPGN